MHLGHTLSLRLAGLRVDIVTSPFTLAPGVCSSSVTSFLQISHKGIPHSLQLNAISFLLHTLQSVASAISHTPPFKFRLLRRVPSLAPSFHSGLRLGARLPMTIKILSFLFY